MTKKASRSVPFRQNRHDAFAEHLRLTIEGKVYPLSNWSRTGISFKTHAPLQKGDRLKNVLINASGIQIYNGALEINNCRPNPANQKEFLVGAAFRSGLFFIEKIESAINVHQTQNQVTRLLTEIRAIDQRIAHGILLLRNALRTIRESCDKEEQRWRTLIFDQKMEAEKLFQVEMSKVVHAILTNFNKDMHALIDVETLPDDSIYHRLFEKEIYRPFFQKADLSRRAFEKPQGYAGDFEMMNQIYRNAYEGQDLFSQIMHNYMTNEASSNSVKFRRPYFINFMKQALKRGKSVKFLSVASGPAVEVQQVVRDWSQSELDKIHFTLFDLDREALSHAQTKIYDSAQKQGKQTHIAFINDSVKSFVYRNLELGEKFDLIYSGGLFDYLDNPTSTVLITKFSEMLNPGGTAVIGNFTKDNTTKSFCHLITHWSLIHKTKEEIRAWADHVTDCTVDVEFDDEKINAFLVIRKKGG